mmetsp:Transcript_21736/g.74734  ORF Transcript_21736/g.74734 Transcript_21736/m.74734 type:complete len:311 (+) Transcript_21736:870-1802(+)
MHINHHTPTYQSNHDSKSNDLESPSHEDGTVLSSLNIDLAGEDASRGIRTAKLLRMTSPIVLAHLPGTGTCTTLLSDAIRLESQLRETIRELHERTGMAVRLVAGDNDPILDPLGRELFQRYDGQVVLRAALQVPQEVRGAWLQNIVGGDQAGVRQHVVVLQQLEVDMEAGASLVHENHVGFDAPAKLGQVWDCLLAVATIDGHCVGHTCELQHASRDADVDWVHFHGHDTPAVPPNFPREACRGVADIAAEFDHELRGCRLQGAHQVVENDALLVAGDLEPAVPVERELLDPGDDGLGVALLRRGQHVA